MMVRHPAKNDKKPQRRDLFSAAFHAEHASTDDLGFDASDGDFSWATEQLNDEDRQRRALHQQIQDKFKIKPKVQKIGDDDETWFSEASDAEGPVHTAGPRKGKKKIRRKAGALGMGNKSPSGVRDNAMLQHSNKADDDLSEEENLYEFTADFAAFGNQDALVGDLTQSSGVDDLGFDSSNHTSKDGAYSVETSSTSGIPIRSNASTTSFSSHVSGKKSVASASTKSHKSFSMVPVPQSPKCGDDKSLKRMTASCSRSLPGLDVSEGADDTEDAWLGPFIDNVIEKETKSQQHATTAKAKNSVTAAVAAMNKKHDKNGADGMGPNSTHSAQSTNMSPAKKVYMMKSKRAVDPLSSSDHGPSRHSRGTGSSMIKTGQRAKLARQKSDPTILEESVASLNASSLLQGSSSLEAGGSPQGSHSLHDGAQQVSQASLQASQLGLRSNQRLQASQVSLGVSQLGLQTSQSMQASRTAFHASQPIHSNNTNGMRENKQGMHASQPIKSVQTGSRPRRKVVRKVTRTASGEDATGGPPRRRVPSRANSMSGSSDDGGGQGGRRRIVRRRPSSNNESSESPGKGTPLKKKIIRRRASDGGGLGEENDDLSLTVSVTSGAPRQRERVASIKTKPNSSEIAKVSTAAKSNMTKVQDEIKQAARTRKLKPEGAPMKQPSLGTAIEKESQPARRMVKRQSSARTAVSSENASAGIANGVKSGVEWSCDIAATHNPDEAKKAIRASSSALESHMVKRHPVQRPGRPSGSASLAGHEMKMKKKTAPSKAVGTDLSKTLPGSGGPKFSGSASVAGDQVAARRPVAKRLVKKKPVAGDGAAPPSRRKPQSPPDKSRPAGKTPRPIAT